MNGSGDIFNSTFPLHGSPGGLSDPGSTGPGSTGPGSTALPVTPYQCEEYDLVMGFFIKLLIVVLGTVGNLLTVYVLWGEKRKTGTAFLLVALAFADTSVLIVWGWMDAMPSLMNYWPVLPGLRRVWGYFNAYMWALGSITHMASTWLVTMVTLLRYVAVCHPLEAGRMTSVRMVQWETLICVVFSIVFYLPRCFEYGVMYDVTNDVYVRQKRDWASGDTYNLIYKVLLYYVFIYVIPLSTLIYCTHKLIRSLKHSREKKERMTSTSKRRASLKDKDMDFTKSLIIVVIIFIICQLFNPVRRFLYDYFLDPGHRKCPYFYHYFQLISGNALMLNSAVNFLCYFLSAPGFKRKFLAKCSFCACVKRRVRPETETMDMSESV